MKLVLPTFVLALLLAGCSSGDPTVAIPRIGGVYAGAYQYYVSDAQGTISIALPSLASGSFTWSGSGSVDLNGDSPVSYNGTGEFSYPSISLTIPASGAVGERTLEGTLSADGTVIDVSQNSVLGGSNPTEERMTLTLQ